MGKVQCKEVLFEKLTIEARLKQALGFVVLNRDRAIEKLKSNERIMRDGIIENKISVMTFKNLSNSNIRLINYAMASNEVIQIYNTLLNNSLALQMGQENPLIARELEDYLRTACWATYRMNIPAMMDINHMVIKVLGKDFEKQAHRGHRVGLRIQKCFGSLIASPLELYEYKLNFLKRMHFNEEEEGNIFLYLLETWKERLEISKPEPEQPHKEIFDSEMKSFSSGQNFPVNDFVATPEQQGQSQGVNPLLVSKLENPNDPNSRAIHQQGTENLHKSVMEKVEDLDSIEKNKDKDHGLNQDFLLHLSQLPDFTDNTQKVENGEFGKAGTDGADISQFQKPSSNFEKELEEGDVFDTNHSSVPNPFSSNPTQAPHLAAFAKPDPYKTQDPSFNMSKLSKGESLVNNFNSKNGNTIPPQNFQQRTGKIFAYLRK